MGRQPIPKRPCEHIYRYNRRVLLLQLDALIKRATLLHRNLRSISCTSYTPSTHRASAARPVQIGQQAGTGICRNCSRRAMQKSSSRR